MVRNVVSELESNFDNVGDKLKTSVTFTSTWKDDAKSLTLSEIPRLALVGTEVGSTTGFGSTIYESSSETRLNKTVCNVIT